MLKKIKIYFNKNVYKLYWEIIKYPLTFISSVSYKEVTICIFMVNIKICDKDYNCIVQFCIFWKFILKDIWWFGVYEKIKKFTRNLLLLK